MATKPETAGRWRVGDGEEARLTPGASAAAEVWSRGFLPLRVRSEGSYRLRPAFPGTAVVLGDGTYEVLSETELPDEVETQERLCDRLGLYAVTATLVSGLAESLLTLLVLLFFARASEEGRAILLLTALPGLVLLVLPGLGRAFGAVLLRETGGSAPVLFAFETLRALGALRGRRDRSFVPLTRSAFWERLGRPDTVEAASDGTLGVRGLLPHLTWGGSTPLSVGRDFWGVVPEPPVLDRGRLVYAYRLEPLGDATATGEPAPSPPPATAYAEEVLGRVRREWNWLNEGFAWLTCMLSADVQARAFDHRGGPSAARRPTMVTAVAWDRA